MKISGCIWFIILFVTSRSQLTGLNFFVSKEEWNRTVGVFHEIFYITNGTKRDYALRFKVPVQYKTRRLNFYWQNTGEQDIFFELDARIPRGPTHGLRILYDKSLRSGVVPRKLSAFAIDPLCTGKDQGSIAFHISVNFTQRNKTTHLILRRLKNCKYGLPQKRRPVDDHEDFNNNNRGREKQKIWFYSGAGLFCGLVIIVATVIAVCFARSRRPKKKQTFADRSSENGSKYSQALLQNNTSDSSQSHASTGYSLQLSPTQVRTALSELMIDKSRLTLTQVLLEGTFGRVSHGLISVHCETDEMGFIMVKSVTEAADSEQIENFLRDACLLRNVLHENIQKLAGVSLDPPMLVYARSTHTQNLKTYLLDRKNMVLSTPEVVYIALQITRGTMHLHKMGIIHKDISARNCTIDEQFKVKVADPALSADLFPDDYQRVGDKTDKPIRWLAIECLKKNFYSGASDAWAVGITIWEIINLGQQPYPGINPFDICEYLEAGYRLSQPTLCPDHLFTVMAHCWSAEPRDRPTLSQVVVYLRDFYTTLGCFV